MNAEKIVLNQDRNVTLTAYTQDVGGEFPFALRPAVLILPGGGYQMCSDKEADPVAFEYLKEGYQAFVLRYTLSAAGRWPLPLEDYEQAMGYITDHADRFHVYPDKIAVIGFSAGGHLAACAATMAAHRPAAAILVYPAILKEMLEECQPNLPLPAEAVDEKTPPCFIASTRDDCIVPVENELQFELALARAGIQFESHIYSFGDHGFATGLADMNPAALSVRVREWPRESISWLEEVLGVQKGAAFTPPLYGNLVNENAAPTLSVQCTLAHLEKQGERAQAVIRPLLDAIAAIERQRGLPAGAIRKAMGNTKTASLLQMAGMSGEQINELNAALHAIPNRR